MADIHPATVWNGATATLLRQEEIFDPALGVSWRQEWVGTADAIAAKRAAALVAGWRVTRHKEGDQDFLTIVTPDPALVGEDPAAEVPVDVYELSTEFASAEIWTNPKILSFALGGGLTTEKTRDVISRFKHFVVSRTRDLYTEWVDFADETEARQDGRVTVGMGPTPIDKTGLWSGGAAAAAPTADLAFGDANGATRVGNLYAIFFQSLMGLETWEPRRIILSRRRTCSAKYAAQHVVDGVEKVYTTAALKSLFAIPNGTGEVGTRLPADPSATPPDSAWAWKIRRQDSQQLRGTARVEEVIDWQFAAWSTLIYDVVTS